MRDRNGHIGHDGGVVTGAPGLYVLGPPVLRIRASTYIDGAAADSEALASHLHSFLSSQHIRAWLPPCAARPAPGFPGAPSGITAPP